MSEFISLYTAASVVIGLLAVATSQSDVAWLSPDAPPYFVLVATTVFVFLVFAIFWPIFLVVWTAEALGER
jgi:hypothetical protein